MVSFRQLVSGDEAITNTFLASRPDTTMFLRSNLRRSSLSYSGEPYEGVYAGAFEGEGLVGVAAHYWNGNVIVAGGSHVTALIQRVAALSHRAVKGLLGTHDEVLEATRALDLAISSARYSSKEVLYRLDLAGLVVPPSLVDGSVEARTPNDDEMALLLEWRMAYAAETMNTPDTPETRVHQARALEGFHRNREDILVLQHGEPVAYSGFNATLADIVQVGGVWTPPVHRRRGYARCAVAASLLHARARSVVRAILFTGEENVSANRAYAALGFRPVGDYSLVFFD